MDFANASNEQSIEQYKTNLSEVISSGEIDKAKKFIDHILSDNVALAVSKKVLHSFAQDLGKFEAVNRNEIATYTLDKIRPLGLEEQARMIASKMNCDDGMRVPNDKDIEVTRGMPKKRRVEVIPGSEERGSKGSPKDLMVKKYGTSLKIEKFEARENLRFPTKLFPVESMDPSLKIEKFEARENLRFPTKFLPVESMDPSLKIEKFEGLNNLRRPVYTSSMPSTGELEILEVDADLSRPKFVPVKGNVLNRPVVERRGTGM